jgi:hypothetical protein
MNAPLPVKSNLTRAYTLSLMVALLMAGSSLAGLLFQNRLYPTEELRRSFVSNDAVNLFIGLPLLVGAMWFTRRGRLIGLLFWPGALLYVIYNYVACIVAVPLTVPSGVYLALVALSAYALILLFSGVDLAAVHQRLGGAVPERFAGDVLVGFGALFFLRSIGQAVSALSGQAALGGPALGVLVADFVTTPVWMAGGVLLWRRQALGYAAGAGLLFQASMLFVGLLVFFILQPFLTATPFPMQDFVVIFVMGLVCFVPLALFIRGILIKG